MNHLAVVAPQMPVSDVERVALAIAKGGLFGSTDPNAVLTLCLLAQAEGQHPAVVFRDYHIIQGKPAKKAEAMLRDFINAGGKVEWHQLDDACADATFSHPSGSARIDWTIERAKKAGISTAMWNKYPRQMLRSRVISEGIRTVYPGATSGLYEEGEVASIVGAPPPELAHDIQTGEVIDAQAEKVPGISKIKERLNKFMRDGNACDDLEAFREMKRANKDDIKAIRDGNHSYWTGDGEDSEGFAVWMERRQAELTPQEETARYQLILSGIDECASAHELRAWFKHHGDQLGLLDGEESRLAQAAFDDKELALHTLEQATAGG